MILKETLMSLNVFIDNEYFDEYIDIINNNIDRKREKFKTQKHHIIPRAYFKHNKLLLDNSDNNIVNLLYKDHILVHYYLCQCTLG